MYLVRLGKIKELINMKTTVIKFGIYGLLTAALLFLAALVLGKELSFSTQEVIGYISMVVSLSFVFFGIKSYRDKVNNGNVSFGKAFTIGILISLFAGLGFGIVDYIYTTVINPDFMEQYIETMRSQGHEGEIPTYSSGFLALIMFLTVAVIGIIISLLSALVLKKS